VKRWLLTFSLLSATWLGAGVHGVDALSVTSKPSAPVVSVVSVTKGSKKGKVNVTVSFALASTNAKSPLILTQVKVGTGTCTAVKKSSKCTVKNVVSGKTYKVQSRSKNRNGFGRWSSAVAVKAVLGNKWQRNDSSGNSSTSNPSSGVSTSSLKFNLKNAVGLTLSSSVSSSSVRKFGIGSNLKTIDGLGVTTDAVSSGSASIARFLIAPNNKLYVLFNTKTAVGTASCLLAEVDKTTGDPTCIESEILSVNWETELNGSSPIQFSATGAIYYMGRDGVAPNDSSVLRRYSDGKTTSLVTNNILLSKFLVLETGDVLLEGSTKGTGASWLRKVSATGQLSTILAPFSSYLMLGTSDGNVILHSYFTNSWGYKRYITNESRIESDYWIIPQAGGSPVSRFNLTDICLDGQSVKNNAFCSGAGHTKLVIRTSTQKVLLLQTYNGKNSSLTQVYPTLAEMTLGVTNVGIAQSVLDYVIMSGTNSNGQNITTLYNTSTNTEQNLVPASNEIEMYHLNYVASSNKIMFDGLRFSDNKYVIGQIDLNTGTVTASQTGSSKHLDFQTFGS
jgi:hypothetical protein